MYTLTVARAFDAQHYLTVPDPGPEGQVHSHRYTVDATFEGATLDEHGYVLDIEAVGRAMDETVAEFRGNELNDLPAFAGKNPSVEHFARIFGDALLERIDGHQLTGLTVAVQEDDVAVATHSRTL